MQRIWEIVRREPLVAFIFLGAAFYALMIAVRPADQTETIEVSAETIRALVEAQEELAGRRLSPEEVRTIMEGHVDDEVLACIHCGFCRVGCPTFAVTHRESRNARGRNALSFYLLNGSLEPSPELADAFYSCTTCQACTYHCPAQIKVDEIVEGVRRQLYEAGLAPEAIQGVRDNILKTGNVYASAKKDRIDIYPPGLKRCNNQLEPDQTMRRDLQNVLIAQFSASVSDRG